MGNVKRIYVEKKEPFAVKAKELKEELGSYLGIEGVKEVRVLIRYDVENISEAVFEKACRTVFSEPPVDMLYEEEIEIPTDGRVFGVEYLPGQFDQRADSAVQCVKFLKEDEEPVIRTAVTYLIVGQISDDEFEKIKAYCINPVDSRETDMKKPDTLIVQYEEPADVAVLADFCSMPETEFRKLYDSLGLAMTFKDFWHIRKYYDGESTESDDDGIRVLILIGQIIAAYDIFTNLRCCFRDGYYQKPIRELYGEVILAAQI